MLSRAELKMQGASRHLCELEVGAVSLLAKLERVHVVALEGGPVTQAARICPVEHSPQLSVRILHHAACQPRLVSIKPALPLRPYHCTAIHPGRVPPAMWQMARRILGQLGRAPA